MKPKAWISLTHVSRFRVYGGTLARPFLRVYFLRTILLSGVMLSCSPIVLAQQQCVAVVSRYLLRINDTQPIVEIVLEGSRTLTARFEFDTQHYDLPPGCPLTLPAKGAMWKTDDPSTASTAQSCDGSDTCTLSGNKIGSTLLHLTAYNDLSAQPTPFLRPIKVIPQPMDIACTTIDGTTVPCGGGCVLSPAVASLTVASITSSPSPAPLPLNSSCDPGGISVFIVAPGDPNDKAGSQGVGALQYIAGATPLRYAVFFGNEPTATAPAQKVIVTDQLNVSSEDLTTFNFGPIALPNQLVSPPEGLSDFSTTVDLRPSNNILVTIKTHLDISSGLLTWTFQSLDPTTNQPPTDPTVGFLPPGTAGSTFFTVMPKPELSTNTQIQNQATVVFDANPPMTTSTWTNTLDNTPPASHVVALPATEFSARFVVSWSGTDIGAGVQDFTIYVSDDGGPFTAFQTNTTATSVKFTGQNGHTYAFYSVARDLVGNVEPAKTAAEATTLVSVDTIPPTTTAVLSPVPNAAGWNNSNVTVSLTSVDNPGGSGVQQITYSATGAQTIPSAVVPGSSTFFTISNEGITTISFFGTDNAGNVESARTLTIQLDKTPPTVACSASPNVLWPPNNKLVPIDVSVNVSDALSGPGGFTLVSVTSNEPDSGQGDIQRFVTGTASTSGQLRAQRLGSGTGRVYTFTYTGADRAGNTASCTTTVSVPHDQGN